MDGSRIKIILSIILNAGIVISETAAFIYDYRKPDHGPKCFRYFTVDSNLFLALASLVLIPFECALLALGTKLPFSVLMLKYLSTVAVTVTMMTVMVFLGPTQGYGRMLKGSGFWMHLTDPVLALVTFALLDGGEVIPSAIAFTGIIPVIVYGIVYLICVLIKKCWPDFYGFNAGGRWYIAFMLMLAGAALLCLGVNGLHTLFIGLPA